MRRPWRWLCANRIPGRTSFPIWILYKIDKRKVFDFVVNNLIFLSKAALFSCIIRWCTVMRTKWPTHEKFKISIFHHWTWFKYITLYSTENYVMYIYCKMPASTRRNGNTSLWCLNEKENGKTTIFIVYFILFSFLFTLANVWISTFLIVFWIFHGILFELLVAHTDMKTDHHCSIENLWFSCWTNINVNISKAISLRAICCAIGFCCKIHEVLPFSKLKLSVEPELANIFNYLQFFGYRELYLLLCKLKIQRIFCRFRKKFFFSAFIYSPRQRSSDNCEGCESN
jgi:hypothetical protein